MRVLANMFLLLFLADSSISILDEVVSLVAPLPALSASRDLVAGAVIVLSMALYASLGIDRRIPKGVFLPLILFAWLCPAVPWLFPALEQVKVFGLVVAAAQMLLFMVVTARFWKMDGRKDGAGFMMPQSMFEGACFSWKNTVGFAALNVVIAPFLLVLMSLSSADAYVNSYTAGFVRLRADGLHMREKVYRRGEKVVRLAGMIHVGEKQYYEQVVKAQQGHRTLVLAEGVTDDRHLLSNRLDYGRVAEYLGLSTQQEDMLLRGRVIEPEQLAQRKATAPREGQPTEPDILRADVDLSSFRPSTIWFLNEIGKQMKGGQSVGKQLIATMAWSQKNVTPELQQVITDDILHSRNKELMRHLRQALPYYDVVVVPWGALHMAEIEADLVKQGFQLQQVNDKVSIHFFQDDGR